MSCVLMSLSDSLLQKISAFMDHLCQIALNKKLSHKIMSACTFMALYHCILLKNEKCCRQQLYTEGKRTFYVQYLPPS